MNLASKIVNFASEIVKIRKSAPNIPNCASKKHEFGVGNCTNHEKRVENPEFGVENRDNCARMGDSTVPPQGWT